MLRVSSLIMMLAGLAPLSGPPVRADEPLAVIVNKSNPVENVTLEELRKYCMVERSFWNNDKRITVVLRDPGQTEREAVLSQVYRMSEYDFSRYFLQGEFTGAVHSAPKRLSSAAGVRRFVFNVPGAIGFVRAGEVDGTVKVLRVNGYAPGDPQYPLRLR